jgi:beta-lactamase regulating signal transducer with metallopeptidase domain
VNLLSISSVETLSQHAAAALLTSLWQAGLIAFGLALCLRFIPRTTAATRFIVWAVGFAVAFALPMLPGLIGLWPQTQALSTLPVALNSEATHSLLQLDWRWSIAIAALWLAASLYRAFDLVLHSQRLRLLWKSAQVQEISDIHLQSFPLRRTIEICTSQELQRPSVIGFFAPRVLIPDWLFTRLTPAELDQILAHESEHLRRSDDWTNLLQKLALIVFPLNPALLWMEHQLCREREMACDEAVVRRTNAPRAYATCLTRIAERGLQHQTEALSLGAWHKRPELARRIHSILLQRQTLQPAVARGLVAAVGCALLLGSLELSRCPQLISFTSAESSVDAASALPVGPAQISPTIGRDPAQNSVRYVPAMAIMPDNQRIGQNIPYRSAPKTAQRSHMGQRQSVTAPAEDSGLEQQEAALLIPEKAQQIVAGQTEQQYIVLTTFEQFEAPSRSGKTVSDEADAQTADPATARAAIQAPANPSEPAVSGNNAASRVTVTQLIFRIVPAAQAPPSGKGSSIPVFRPTGTGWLVFQL